MRISVLYHYFHPDDVISARLYSDLAQHLSANGHEVEAIPCNRSCRNEKVTYPSAEEWKDVSIRRVRRLPLRQATATGRIVNSISMMASWASYLISHKPDLVIIGTDPQGSLSMLPLLKPLLKKTRIIHWCHDLYPQLLKAEGISRDNGVFYRMIYGMMRKSYRYCDMVIDIGPKMRNELTSTCPDIRHETITPWALIETNSVNKPDATIRERLFGNARLALLYSGNYGRAHHSALFFELARELKHQGLKIIFSVRGNKVHELQENISSDDTNIQILKCVDETDLQKHIEASDIQLVSLKDEYSGFAVPSKYFGSIALGRPVIYAGSSSSDIGQLIERDETGHIINNSNKSLMIARIKELIREPESLYEMQQRAHMCYMNEFNKDIMLRKWIGFVDEIRC